VSEFPNAIDAYWHESFLTGDRLFSSETLTVTVNPDLAADRRLMLLETVDGKVMAVLTPELTDRMRLSQHHDLTDLYSPRLRALCREVDGSLDEGVYVQFPGPHYETPAEVRMAGILGGHLVGMSTTLEAIAAREAGMEVLGISLVTNLAAGLSGEPLDHAEVLEAGRAAASRMGGLLSQVAARI